jgi:hypothetical protein
MDEAGIPKTLAIAYGGIGVAEDLNWNLHKRETEISQCNDYPVYAFVFEYEDECFVGCYATSRKSVIFILVAVRTWNITTMWILSLVPLFTLPTQHNTITYFMNNVNSYTTFRNLTQC